MCSQYCVMLLGRSLNTCHCLLFYLSYFIICITFNCSLAKDRVLYITHQSRVPTGPVVLHTGNFLGYCQGCGVLIVLYYKMVLKCTLHKRPSQQLPPSLSRQYLLHVRNQAPLFITAPLLSLSYTASYIEPNVDLSWQNTTLQGPKPQITIELRPQHNINTRSGHQLHRPIQGCYFYIHSVRFDY